MQKVTLTNIPGYACVVDRLRSRGHMHAMEHERARVHELKSTWCIDGLTSNYQRALCYNGRQRSRMWL